MAAHRVGVEVSDGSWLQYLQLQKQGGAITVEEALHTRGALLFYFSTPPSSAGRPGKAHVAISLGDGRTIEARSPTDGVGSFAATSKRFNYAAVIPGLSAAGPAPGADDLPAVPAPHPPAHDTHARAAAYAMPAAPPPDPAPPAGTQAPGAQPGTPEQTDTDKDGSPTRSRPCSTRIQQPDSGRRPQRRRGDGAPTPDPLAGHRRRRPGDADEVAAHGCRHGAVAEGAVDADALLDQGHETRTPIRRLSTTSNGSRRPADPTPQRPDGGEGAGSDPPASTPTVTASRLAYRHPGLAGAAAPATGTPTRRPPVRDRRHRDP